MKIIEYTKMVANGIEGTIVTDLSSNSIPLDVGLEMWADKAKETEEKGGLTFFCGNGASATMAEHMSSDWFQNGMMNTETCSEMAHLTAISNDFSYEDVFAFRIGRMLSKKDILVTISSSGNSSNIVKALQVGKERGAYAITLSGMKDDNLSRSLGDLNFYVPLPTYGLVESAHALLLHASLDRFLDKYMGGMH